MQSLLSRLKEHDFQPSQCDQQLVDYIATISSFLETKGVPVAAFSKTAINKFKTFEEAKKTKAIDQLSTLSALLQNAVKAFEKEIEPTNDVHPERSIVETALKFYKLKLRDDFWATVEPHDILEIYNDEGIQVFRTFNFFNTSGYSLTDLLVNEWYVLWERPKFILQQIFEYSNGILSGQMKGVVKMNVPKHVVKEIYSTTEELVGFTPRSTLIDFGHICALYNIADEHDDKVRGIIVSSRGETNTMGREETKKVIVF